MPRFRTTFFSLATAGILALGTSLAAAPVEAAPAAAPTSIVIDLRLVKGAILERYVALGGPNSFLGVPLTSELPTPNGAGRYNLFQGGSIVWSPTTGAWEVHGLIRDLWGATGFEDGFLGFPTTNENPLVAGGRFSAFQGGNVYYQPVFGTHEVHGAILGHWGEFGWENGRLGYPLTSEVATPDREGAFNHFAGASIYWSPDTGASEIEGRIRDRWAALGWEDSTLGFPAGDEYAIPGGRGQDFEWGQMEWTAAGGTFVTGAVERVATVDLVNNALTLEGLSETYTYDANDDYLTVDFNNPDADPVSITADSFESQVQAGSLALVDYERDPALLSTFILVLNQPSSAASAGTAPATDAVRAALAKHLQQKH
ncbi:MAG: Conserved exported protein of unknown function [Frankiales bacterium]|nr:Conserved exported protein of unknown function [Frankiales bacterium]